MYHFNLLETLTHIAAGQTDALITKVGPNTAQTIHFAAQTLLKVLWSDEARLIFGSSILYPFLAMSVFFLVAQVLPRGTVKKCTGFCLRKLAAMRKRISALLAKLHTDNADSLIRRTQILGSARAFAGAMDVFLF